MVDVTSFLPGLSPVQGKAVVARFDGGQLSSEGGLLALHEIERRLGIADRFAACLKDPRMPEKVVHRLAERLEGDPKGASVLILGAGIAGLVAALELHKIGYKVQILEYNDRAGGRCWSLRGGDQYTELGGSAQTCGFD